MTLFLLVILAALIFEYINGFHDAANAIATVVSTKVLTPRQAIVLAAVCNLIGAFMGTAVAKTVGGGLIDTSIVTLPMVLAALIAGIVWNLLTWWLGLPSSSSHALIGGLCGAALAAAGGNWNVLHWSIKNGTDGLWPKVIFPMFTAPVIGFIVGMLIMYGLYFALRNARPRFVNTVFGKAQLVSAAWMGLSHGTSDAQKTMGVIVLAMISATTGHAFDDLPQWLGFLRMESWKQPIPNWVIVTCAVTIAAGTAAGGWRIVKTMGHKMVKLQPVHGFAAETTAACILFGAAKLGMPLSTTHVISTSIMGVGATKRFSAVKWGVVGRILWAWVLTIPITAALAYGLARLFHLGA